MTKTWKSILSLLLALVMLFGIPNFVIADSSSLGNDYWDVQDDVGFLIDGKTYNLALSKKSYNGVPSGASFFVNDGKIVVDATTIEKLANAQTIFAFHRNGAMDIVVNSEDVNAALNCINQLGDVLVTNTIGSTLWTFSKFAVGAFDGTGNVLDFINNIVNEDMVFYVGVLIAEDNTSRELINILNQLSVLLQAYNQMDRKAIKYEMLIALDSCISLAISRQEELKSIGKRIYSRYGDEAGYNGVNIWGAINSYGSAILSDIS